MLHAIQKSITHNKPVFFTLKNEKTDSPVKSIVYSQSVNGDKGRSQSVNITIKLYLIKNNPVSETVKNLLRQHYNEITDRQILGWDVESFEINATDLKEVVTLLGKTYLSDSVFHQLIKIRSLFEICTDFIERDFHPDPHASQGASLSFFASNKHKIRNLNENIKAKFCEDIQKDLQTPEAESAETCKL